MQKAQSLFSDFSDISSKRWKQQLQFELKGEDYNDVLVWNSPEDIKVRPFYHADEDIAEYPMRTKSSEFKICQNIFVFDVEKSKQKTNDSLLRGAESICYHIQNAAIDVEKLLNNPNLKGIIVHFNLNFISSSFISNIEKTASKIGIKIFLNLDPIGHLAKDGNWIKTSDLDNFESLNKLSNANSKISVDVSLYQNSGANIVQQLAYAMSHANEYFNSCININKTIVFKVGIGSNYFFEIAKLRALRLLFRTISSEYNVDFECYILATPSKRNKTIYDYNINLLRTTTECTAAILGGADAILNLAYDSLYHKDNEFGDRLARNQLLILKNESYLDQVDNPADGSYYIESLTQQLAEKALILFKEIENAGGFIKQLKEGTIQKKIAESAQKEQDLFNSGKEILVGTNKYPNPNDHMKNDLELYPFIKINPRKTLISPIIEKRLAEKMEQERLKTEQ